MLPQRYGTAHILPWESKFPSVLLRKYTWDYFRSKTILIFHTCQRAPEEQKRSSNNAMSAWNKWLKAMCIFLDWIAYLQGQWWMIISLRFNKLLSRSVMMVIDVFCPFLSILSILFLSFFFIDAAQFSSLTTTFVYFVYSTSLFTLRWSHEKTS